MGELSRLLNGLAFSNLTISPEQPGTRIRRSDRPDPACGPRMTALIERPAFSASNSCWLMVPASRSDLASAISCAGGARSLADIGLGVLLGGGGRVPDRSPMPPRAIR